VGGVLGFVGRSWDHAVGLSVHVHDGDSIFVIPRGWIFVVGGFVIRSDWSPAVGLSVHDGLETQSLSYLGAGEAGSFSWAGCWVSLGGVGITLWVCQFTFTMETRSLSYLGAGDAVFFDISLEGLGR
jgi:hypothetical protein